MYSSSELKRIWLSVNNLNMSFLDKYFVTMVKQFDVKSYTI